MTYMVADTGPLPAKYLIADVRRFATDLAGELGGTPTFGDRDQDAAEIRVDGTTAGDLTIRVTGHRYSPREANKITISARVPDLALEDTPRYSDDRYKLPRVNVSAERDIKAIARDVIRRVIEASVEPAAAIREYAKTQRAQRGSLADRIATMKAAYGSEIRFSEDRQDNWSCPFSYYHRIGEAAGNSFFVDGRLTADGTIYMDRVATLTTEQFAGLVQAVKTP